MNKFDDFVLCPVPRHQRPFFEYIERKGSSFLGWVRLNESGYTGKFFFSLLTFFTLSIFFTNGFVSFVFYPIQCLSISLFISLFFQTLFYFNFFLAWNSTAKKLADNKVCYEESTGYNGRIWKKPQSILQHEQLLYHYQLIPIINRIEKTIQFSLIMLILVLLILFALMY